MEVKGNQFGTIQNGDTIINRGSVSATFGGPTSDVQKALDNVQAQLEDARTAGALESVDADAAALEIATARTALAAGQHDLATKRLERIRTALGAAAAATPLVEAVSKLITLLHDGGGR
ncbi:hypothetical protein [Micromonospora profundi]|uniref:hypothetical protein n=1 Tax=Micromonospora profundi TaxID=1420889 RepID=UPI0036632DA0